jgi:hypothetical protein
LEDFRKTELKTKTENVKLTTNERIFNELMAVLLVPVVVAFILSWNRVRELCLGIMLFLFASKQKWIEVVAFNRIADIYRSALEYSAKLKELALTIEHATNLAFGISSDEALPWKLMGIPLVAAIALLSLAKLTQRDSPRSNDRKKKH